MGAIAVCILVTTIAIVGYVYFTIQDKKEEKRAREAKLAEEAEKLKAELPTSHFYL